VPLAASSWAATLPRSTSAAAAGGDGYDNYSSSSARVPHEMDRRIAQRREKEQLQQHSAF
jgi:hypothetical protein